MPNVTDPPTWTPRGGRDTPPCNTLGQNEFSWQNLNTKKQNVSCMIIIII